MSFEPIAAEGECDKGYDSYSTSSEEGSDDESDSYSTSSEEGNDDEDSEKQKLLYARYDENGVNPEGTRMVVRDDRGNIVRLLKKKKPA